MAAKLPDTVFGVWATAWGPMGAVAANDGLTRLVLPHYQMDELAQLLAWEHPSARRDEGAFEQLITLSRDYFNAKPVDFSPIVCRLPAAFGGVVLSACRQIPYGQTLSYSQLAMKIGREDAARAVATALGKNVIPLVIPCHRVIYSGGGQGGFSAPGGIDLKARMLDMEKRSGLSRGQD